MPRLAWLSDLHLDHAPEAAIEAFLSQLQAAEADWVLIGGDTGEARNFVDFLTMIAGSVAADVCFVLGNHDYYRSSVVSARSEAARLNQSGLAKWLPEAGVVELDETTALVGHGGWGDARIGDVFGSDVFLNDYVLIDELREVASPGFMTDELVERLNFLGDDAASKLQTNVAPALQQYNHVIVLTHVPPYIESAWHEGQCSDDNWAPHFTCKAVGDMLKAEMSAQPSKLMTVLCGHTHGEGSAQILPNLEVRTALARYGQPAVYCTIEV